jgi:hypothetical protein
MFRLLVRILQEALAIALGCVIAFAIIYRRFSVPFSFILGIIFFGFWFVSQIPMLNVESRAARLRKLIPELRNVELFRTPGRTESALTVWIVIAVEIVILVVVAYAL